MVSTRPHLGSRALAGALAAGLLGAAMIASPVAAAGLVHSSFSSTVAHDTICGIASSSASHGVVNSGETVNSAGFPEFQSTVVAWSTFTNAATGKSVTIFSAGRTQDVSTVASGPDLITVTTAITGLPEQIRASDGRVLSADAGNITIATVLNDGGTPLDTSDDTFVSQSVVFEAGPHPDFDSGFALFCNAVVAALT